MALSVTNREFGRLPDGQVVTLYTLQNSSGIQVSLMDYGGIITSVKLPDREGNIDEVTLAYDELDNYLPKHPFFGAFVGRFANRIDNGRFELDGKTYQLAQNKGDIHLHGGERGFDKHLWEARALREPDRVGLALHRVSPDGEESYPGRLDVQITVSLNDENDLAFEYSASTDAPTPVNLTNHTYWNLGPDRTILEHQVKLHADERLEVDDRAIPTGRIVPVHGTPFDFTEMKSIGADFDQLRSTAMLGYDHCFCVSGWDPAANRTLLPVAEVVEPRSGRTMSVRSTTPGFQFYSGNHLVGAKGRRGETLQGQEAFCIETQFYPDSVNHANFPDSILRPGEEYYQATVHSFGVM